MPEEQDQKKMFRRESDLKELQEKFNKFIGDLASEKASGENIPDIVETMHKEKKLTHPFAAFMSRYRFIIFLIVVSIIMTVPFPMPIDFIGTVIPATKTVIRVPHDGTLKDVRFKYGDMVKKDDIICWVYNERYGLEKELKGERLKTAEEELAASERLAQDLQVILERKNKLSKQGLVSATELDQAQLEHDKAEIAHLNVMRETKALKEAMALLESLIQESTIRSQIDGIFMTPNLAESANQFLQKGEKLCEVADVSDFIIEISMKEKDMMTVREGQRVSVRFSTHPFKAYAGEIFRIGYYVADAIGSKGRVAQPTKDQYFLITFEAKTTKTISAYINVQDIPKDIKYGMAAKVRATRVSNIWSVLFPKTT